jgi:DNA repair ATPase RecN
MTNVATLLSGNYDNFSRKNGRFELFSKTERNVKKERKTKMVRLNVVGVFALLSCALFLAGCKDKEKQQALLRAAEAEMKLSKVGADLTKAASEVASLKEELGAAKSARDELAQQVKQLTIERDNAIAQTAGGQDAVKKLAEQLKEQTDKAGELQKQVAQLQKVIEDQRQTVEQLQKNIDGLKIAPAPGAAEPNAITTVE